MRCSVSPYVSSFRIPLQGKPFQCHKRFFPGSRSTRICPDFSKYCKARNFWSGDTPYFRRVAEVNLTRIVVVVSIPDFIKRRHYPETPRWPPAVLVIAATTRNGSWQNSSFFDWRPASGGGGGGGGTPFGQILSAGTRHWSRFSNGFTSLFRIKRKFPARCLRRAGRCSGLGSGQEGDGRRCAAEAAQDNSRSFCHVAAHALHVFFQPFERGANHGGIMHGPGNFDSVLGSKATSQPQHFRAAALHVKISQASGVEAVPVVPVFSFRDHGRPQVCGSPTRKLFVASRSESHGSRRFPSKPRPGENRLVVLQKLAGDDFRLADPKGDTFFIMP